MEVSHDLMTQMPDKSSDILQAMEIEQYFFADEAQSTREDPHLVNGYHINFYLRDVFVRQCKAAVVTLCRPKRGWLKPILTQARDIQPEVHRGDPKPNDGANRAPKA